MTQNQGNPMSGKKEKMHFTILFIGTFSDENLLQSKMRSVAQLIEPAPYIRKLCHCCSSQG